MRIEGANDSLTLAIGQRGRAFLARQEHRFAHLERSNPEWL
jgi:hypothetical protein